MLHSACPLTLIHCYQVWYIASFGPTPGDLMKKERWKVNCEDGMVARQNNRNNETEGITLSLRMCKLNPHSCKKSTICIYSALVMDTSFEHDMNLVSVWPNSCGVWLVNQYSNNTLISDHCLLVPFYCFSFFLRCFPEEP